MISTSASYDATDNDTRTTASLGTGISSVDIPAEVETALYIVAFILNVFGNTTIIVAIAKFSWLQHNMYVALQTLAVADLQLSVHTFLIMVRRFTYAAMFPKKLSSFISYMRTPLMTGAAYHVGLVAMERFVAIVFPFQYNAHITPGLIWISSGVLWLISVLISIPDIILNFQPYLHITLSPSAVFVARSFPNLFGYFGLTF